MWTRPEADDMAFFGKFSDYIATQELQSGLRERLGGSALLMSSDYSGEHKGAKNDIYAFLVTDDVSWQSWRARLAYLREAAGVHRSMSFKDLGDRQRRKILPAFLGAADDLNGLLVTVLVDKRSRSFWQGLPTGGATTDLPWTGKIREKALRVSYLGGLLVSGMSAPGQDVVWLMDRDAIVEGDDRLASVIRIFGNVISTWLPHDVGRLRVGALNAASNLADRDLVAVPDLVAGAAGEVWSNMSAIPSPGLLVPVPPISNKAHELIVWFSERQSSLLKVAISVGYKDPPEPQQLFSRLLRVETD